MRVQFFPNHKNHINRGKDTRGFLTRRGLVPPGKGGNDGGDKGGRSGSGSASPTKASGASSGRGNSAPQQQKNGGNKTQQGSPANTPKGSKESSPHRQASKDYVQHVLPLEIDVRGGRAPPINSRRAQQPQRGGWNYQPPFGNNQAHNANTHSLPYRPTNGNKTTRYSSSNNNNNTYQRHSADFGRRSSANNANTAYQMPLHPNPPPGLTIHPNPLQQQWPMPMPLPPGMGMGVSMPNHHQHPPQQYTQQNMMMGWGMDGMGMGMGIQSTQAQAQAQQLMAQTPVPVPTLSPHQHRWGNGALERMAWEQPLPPPRLVGGSGDARNHLGAGGMASPPQPQPMPWGGQTGQVAQGQVVNGGGGGAMSANWRQMM